MNEQIGFVSIVIPCRNEGLFIARCLDSLIANDYPKYKMEILVVDGMSTDDTRDIVSTYMEKYTNIKLLNNPKGITPIAMNIGIESARGEYISKSDAHSVYPPYYISTCVRYLEEYKADVVGGSAIATAAKNTFAARAIVATLSSIFGTGGSRFRTNTTKPIWTDTAFGLIYRKNILERVGKFNRNLARSQDMDINMRIRQIGGKLLLIPKIAIAYYPKTTLLSFFEHNFRDGIWAVLPMRYGAPLFKIRHLLPGLFVLGLAASLAASFFIPFSIYLFLAGISIWLAVAIVFSLSSAAKEKDIFLAPFVFGALGARHFGYGAGSLVGLMRLITG